MHLLLITLLGLANPHDAAIVKALDSTLEVPYEYQKLTTNSDEWLNNLYELDLSPTKELIFNEKQYQNTLDAYLSPLSYQADPATLFLSELKGSIYQRPTIILRSSFTGGDVSAWSQGVAFYEQIDQHLTWGAGFTRSQISKNKRYPYNEGNYNTVQGWLDWRPTENLHIHLNVSHTDKE